MSRFKDMDIREECYNVSKDLTINDTYKIIRVTDFKTAQLFRPYTTWCTSKSLDDYKGYIGLDRQLYICIKENFDKISKEEGDNFPLDEYGLSLIMIIVGEDGNFVYASTRWNDITQFLNPVNLSEIFGLNFFSYFVPKSFYED